MKSLFNYLSTILICLTVIGAGSLFVCAQDMTAETIVAKHLESIGTAARRGEVKNYLAMGASTFESKFPAKKADGKALIVSEGENLYFITSFSSKEYPYEKIGYFNNKVSLPFVTGGARSPLGAFIADHPKILSLGLFTGSMSANWGLLNFKKEDAVIKAAGTKKVGGRKAYAIEYLPRNVGTTEFAVRMYFDAENFHHLRTEYRHEIAPTEDRFGTLGRQSGTKIFLTEDFGDFKEEGGLTLPHTYKVDYQTDSNQGTFEFVWGVTVTQYQFNRNLEPGFFTFEAN
jgi:hypothetical protein